MTPTHFPGRVAAIPALPEQTRTPPSRTGLEEFNTAPADDARHLLLACLRSPSWARRMTAHRPYPDVDALLAASDEAAYDLSPADLSEALAAETWPALPDETYAAAHTALSAAHAAYEARFGHSFVIYVGDAPPGEYLDRILEGVRSRLTNDPEEERAVAAEELRRLARQRLTRFLRGPRNPASGPARPAPGT